MDKLLLILGFALLGCAIVAAGMFAWHGQWGPVILLFLAGFVGKIALGLVEILLLPVSFPMAYFAARGSTTLSSILAVLFGIVSRTAFAAYCVAVLLYCIRVPGPPTWLAIALATSAAGAPFAWAAQRAPDDAHPSHWDLLAAMIGVLVSGALLAFGVGTIPALSPIAILFLISAVGSVIWWVAKGAPQARLDRIMGRGWS